MPLCLSTMKILRIKSLSINNSGTKFMVSGNIKLSMKLPLITVLDQDSVKMQAYSVVVKRSI